MVAQDVDSGSGASRDSELKGSEPADRPDGHAWVVGCEGRPGGGKQGGRIVSATHQIDHHQPAQTLEAQHPGGFTESRQIGGARCVFGCLALPCAYVHIDRR